MAHPSQPTDNPPQPGVAVIGIAAQLPSGSWSPTDLDHESFFDFLLQGGEAYEPIPAERFNTEYLRGNAPGQIATNNGAFLKDLASFDHLEFGVTAKDARAMPIALRRLLTLSLLALRDAGVDYRGRAVGCYMAGVAHDAAALSGHDDAETRGAFSGGPAMLANRVSYHLDLRGPSIPVDTACSASLHAAHLAVQALRAGECDAALVGGAQLNHRFTEWVNYSQGGILSPDGKCKPFDKAANGFGRGEGVVCVVLKRLDDALRDHDHVYATILGTGVNSSGALAPVNAPVAEAQCDAMRRAFAQTGRAPREVDFVELHATGTALGDPTEANWVGREFRRDDELLIGSVKGNVGHLEITSFLASLSKVVSAFRTGLVPPNANFSNPNPAIRWAEHRLRVPTSVEPLRARASSGRALVALTSSGIGGANGHCVVEAPPARPREPQRFWVRPAAADVPTLLIAGGLSPRTASATADALQADETGREANLARWLGRAARSMTWRTFAVARNGEAPKFGEPALGPKKEPKVVFVFSGQGTQYWEMGRELFKVCAPFRAVILELDAAYEAVEGRSLLDAVGLFREESSSAGVDPLGDIWPIAITLPALTMLQLALVDTLAAAGVRPDVVLGHSAGETAMLYACGAASKEAALELAIARGRAMAFMEDKEGAMAAVSCSPEEALRIADAVKAEVGTEEVLEIGCFNARDAVTLSGSARAIEAAVKRAQDAGVFARRLRTRVPVHSAMMGLCEDEYRARVEAVFSRHAVRRPSVETYSTKTGARFAFAFDAAYFWDGTLGPVRFAEALNVATTLHPHATFVEIGPHPVLTSYISSALAGRGVAAVCPMRRPKKGEALAEAASVLTLLGQLVVAGHRCVDLDALYGVPGTGVGDARGKLPPYPFARKIVPHRVKTAEVARQMQHRNGPLNYRQLQVNVETHPGLRDHVIKDEPIMPAAGFMEMAFEFGASKLYEISFHGLLPLSGERPVPVDVRLDGTKWSVRSASATDYTKTWPIEYDRTHATGFLSLDPISADGAMYPALDIAALRAQMTPVNMKGFYDGFRSFAQYGSMYRRVEKVYRASCGEGRIDLLVEVRGDDGKIPNLADYVLHPAILDAAFHAVVHPIVTGNYDKDLYHLPHHVGTVILHAALKRRPFPRKLVSHLTFAKWSPESIVYDMVLADEGGERMCTIEGLEVALHGYRMKTVDRRLEVIYKPADVSLPLRRYIHDTPSCVYAKLAKKTRIIRYTRGGEMEIQKELRDLNTEDPISLWFVALEGIDGDAAVGLARALRREYLSWEVRAVVFDAAWATSNPAVVVRTALAVTDFPLESLVDADGQVQVPLIQPAGPPSSSKQAIDSGMPWTFDGRQVRSSPVPKPPSQHVVVEVVGTHLITDCAAWIFVGERGEDALPVAGISSGPIASHIIVHEGSIVPIPRQDIGTSYSPLGPLVLARALLALAIGPSAFADARRRHGLRVLVTHTDTEIGSQLLDACTALGIAATALSSNLLSKGLEQCYTTPPTMIISGARRDDEVKLLKPLLPPCKEPLLWGSPHVLSRDPWSVGDAVRAAMADGIQPTPFVPFVRPVDRIPSSPDLLTVTPLFDPEKSYLLVGGVGSLGVHIAKFMYERGARYIVLTSRRGRESLSGGDFMTQRLFHHLESVQDLSLVVAVADATSVDAMSGVVDSLERPLGGCMLLSAVLSDRSFAAHKQESFEAAFSPKVDAFRVIEKLAPLDSIDFTICFSSVSAVFGNAGQTNYAAANTIVTGMMRKYKRAFSIVAPLIFDSRLNHVDEMTSSRMRHLVRWSMNARDLCDYIEDGIRIVRQRPIWQYVPDYDFNVVHEDLGPSPLYDHLVTHDEADAAETGKDGRDRVLECVCRVLDLKAEETSPDVPLTAYGLDSLSAASLAHILKPTLAISQIQLLANLTLRDLQSRASDASEPHLGAEAHNSDHHHHHSSSARATAQNMLRLLDQYSDMLPETPLRTPSPPAERDIGSVVITGTMGSLGAHLLARILRAPGSHKVYAFARSRTSASEEEAMARQRQEFESRGLDCGLLDSDRLVIVRCSLEEPHLGISAPLYEEIRTSVARIFHVGWPVDFTMPVAEFDPALRGLVNLIALAGAMDSKPSATLFFASSSGIFRNIDASQPATEDLLEDPSSAAGSGYSESKWLAEHLLHRAATRGVTRAVVVRVGQLSGGINGAWKESEWVPAMISASTVLECLPDGHGVVSWLPVDAAAEAILETEERGGSDAILHLRHPRPQAWSTIMQHFASVLDLPIVPYAEWLKRLGDASDRRDSKHLAPALRLLSIFESGSDSHRALQAGMENNGISYLMSLDKSEELCPRLREGQIPVLGHADVVQWVKYWRRVGALPLSA